MVVVKLQVRRLGEIQPDLIIGAWPDGIVVALHLGAI